jgi:serine/threonine protein kinase
MDNRFKKAARKVMPQQQYKFPLPLRAVPRIFDKIKNNCDLIVKWWKGIQLKNISPDCDFACQKKLLDEMATKAGIQALGEGQYGAAYAACKGDDDCSYVLKMQKADEAFEREVYALYDLNGWEFSPEIFDSWICNGVGFMVIERLSDVSTCITKGMSLKQIQDQIDFILDELHEKGWVHVDTHEKNIMCKNGHLALIDFGWAVKFPNKNHRKLDYVDLQHPLTKFYKFKNDEELYNFERLVALEYKNANSAAKTFYNDYGMVVGAVQIGKPRGMSGASSRAPAAAGRLPARMSQLRRMNKSSSSSKRSDSEEW